MSFFGKTKQIVWQEVNIGIIKGWQCKPLLDFPNLKHLFTGKSGDLNLAKHEPTIFPEKSVEKNRQAACKALDVNYSNLVILPIIHSDKILVLTSETKEITEADAIITDLKDIPMLITAADCVPILLYSNEKKILGLVHAGWRGTVSKIAEKAVTAMQENFMVRPSQITAVIGPAIGQKHYEVSEDVAKQLTDATETDSILDNGGLKPRADLKLANKIQLDNAGVRNIYVSDLDTASNTSLFYSHRMQGRRAGRQGLIACLV